MIARYVRARIEERGADLEMMNSIAMASSNAVQGMAFTRQPLDAMYPARKVEEQIDPRAVVDDITRRAGLVHR